MRMLVILVVALGLSACGYCAPGAGGNVPGGKTAGYCTNSAGGLP